MAKQTILIHVADTEDTRTEVQAEVYGPLAIHSKGKSIATFWTITHLESGKSIGSNIRGKKRAVAAVKALRKEFADVISGTAAELLDARLALDDVKRKRFDEIRLGIDEAPPRPVTVSLPIGDVVLHEVYEALHVGLKRRWKSIPLAPRVDKKGRIKDPAIFTVVHPHSIDRRVLACVCYRMIKMGEVDAVITLEDDHWLRVEAGSAVCRLPAPRVD